MVRYGMIWYGRCDALPAAVAEDETEGAGRAWVKEDVRGGKCIYPLVVCYL